MKKIFVLFVVLMFSLNSCELEYIDNGEMVISTNDSKVKVMVIPTNEELAIARETVALI